MKFLPAVLPLSLLSSLFLFGCAESGPEASGALSDFPTPEGVGNFYFACDSTSHELTETTRLKCEDAQCIYLSLTYEVSAQVAAGADSCEISRTYPTDMGTTLIETMGTYAFRGNDPAEINVLSAPDSAMLSGSGPIKVKYPAAGKYKFWLTRARQAVSISPVN